MEIPAKKSDSGGANAGNLAFWCAVAFLLSWAYPISAGLLGNYEPEMLVLPLLVAVPAFLIGTIAGVIGWSKRQRRSRRALLMIWVPFILMIVQGVWAVKKYGPH